MLAALASERALPMGTSWTRPGGGMFLWLTLPAGHDAEALLERALTQQVAFVPGRQFHPGGGGANTMRLNFSHSGPAQIVEGVRRLGVALRAEA
jgi:DNA-binding transcriptional MocR family regulator